MIDDSKEKKLIKKLDVLAFCITELEQAIGCLMEDDDEFSRKIDLAIVLEQVDIANKKMAQSAGELIRL